MFKLSKLKYSKMLFTKKAAEIRTVEEPKISTNSRTTCKILYFKKINFKTIQAHLQKNLKTSPAIHTHARARAPNLTFPTKIPTSSRSIPHSNSNTGIPQKPTAPPLPQQNRALHHHSGHNSKIKKIRKRRPIRN